MQDQNVDDMLTQPNTIRIVNGAVGISKAAIFPSFSNTNFKTYKTDDPLDLSSI
jgi:hypothetical protein